MDVLTCEELRCICRDHGIVGYSNKRKAELIALLQPGSGCVAVPVPVPTPVTRVVPVPTPVTRSVPVPAAVPVPTAVTRSVPTPVTRIVPVPAAVTRSVPVSTAVTLRVPVSTAVTRFPVTAPKPKPTLTPTVESVTCSLPDSTRIRDSKKYPTIGDFKKAPEASQSNVLSHLEPSPVRDALDEWMFRTVYSKRKLEGYLTNRIVQVTNKVCYRHHFIRAFLNGRDVLSCGVRSTILNDETLAFTQKLHAIYPSSVGSFLDYLMRRLIAEHAHVPFRDCRVEEFFSCKHECGKDQCKMRSYEPRPDGTLVEEGAIFPVCQALSVTRVMAMDEFKTADIVRDVYMTSMAHSESFGQAPTQEEFDAIWALLNDAETVSTCLVEPLSALASTLLDSSTDVVLNPGLGGPLDIIQKGFPADADLIVGDTLFDFKCTKGNNDLKDFIQLLTYATMTRLHPRFRRKINTIKVVNLYQGTCVQYSLDFLTEKNCVDYLSFLTKDDLPRAPKWIVPSVTFSATAKGRTA